MSTLKVNTLQTAAGVEVYTAKAWVNFNGTGTVAIRASGNVTSITDNGTGDYTVNFTNAMSDANYSVVGTVQNTTYPVRNNSLQPTTYSTSSISVNCITANASFGSLYDQNYVNIAVFR